MTSEYFENGYIDDDPEPEELEDDMPDEPEYIAMVHENWDALAEPTPHWGDTLIRERVDLIRAVERAGHAAGYTTPALMYKAVEEFDAPLLQRTVSGLEDETLEKMLAGLADELALKLANENLSRLSRIGPMYAPRIADDPEVAAS